MAKGNASLLLSGISGQIGKQIVVKQYADKTVIAAYPHSNKKEPTALKKVYEERFRQADLYAKAIVRNPSLKALYQLRIGPGKRVYNFAVSEYLLHEKT